MAVRSLVVWCPDWPVVATGIPLDVPSAVLFANRVVACSPAAREEGVSRGLRKREAQGRAPGLVTRELDPSAEARAFEPVVAAVEAFCPRVEITRPGLAAVGTRGPSRYFGGDAALAALVADAVGTAIGPELGASCRIGVADGPFAAALAARAVPPPQEGATADPATVIPPGQSPAFLRPFPVGVLVPMFPPELADLLRRLGIRSLGAFADLPASDVLARFGPDGARAHRLASGLDERPLDARDPPPDLVVSAELDPPADRIDAAAFTAKALADELHERLSARGLGCTRLLVEAETEHGERLARLWRHDGPLTAGAVVERVRWQLDGWLTTSARARARGERSGPTAPTSGLTMIRLTPDEVVPDRGRQTRFWGGEAAADDRAHRALARLQGMLGPDAVGTPVVGGGRQPAEQVRLVPWGEPREPALPCGPQTSPVGGKETPPWPGRTPGPAPALVHDPPVAVTVLADDGFVPQVSGRGLLSDPPATVDGVDVVAWAGPWIADERWWDPAAHRRRAAFQVVTADGAARLLALEGGQWWLEATYA